MFDLHVFNFTECPPEAFRLRYQIYVEEMERQQPYANHKSRTIIDPMDSSAHHGVAFADGKVAAVIRLNFVRDGGVDPYYTFYEINKLPLGTQDKISICTRNMVASAYRSTPLAFRMLKLMYILALENGSTACYIDVNAPLVPMFEKIGCKPLFEKEHSDYGLVTVMRLDGLDLDHLISVRSPFVPICRKYLKRLERKGSADFSDQAADLLPIST